MRNVKVIFEQRDHDHERNGGKQLHDTLHDDIDLAAVVALDRTVDRTHKEVDACNDEREEQRESGSAGKAGKDVLTGVVGAKEEQGMEELIRENRQNLSLCEKGTNCVIIDKEYKVDINL